MDIARNGFNSVEGISPVREVDIQGYPACHWLTMIVTHGWSFPRVMLLTTGPKLDFFFLRVWREMLVGMGWGETAPYLSTPSP